MWVKSGPSGTPPALQIQRKELTGLKPGTHYDYEVPDAGKGSFTTPPKDDGNFSFVVFGDNRTRHDVYRQVSAAIAAAKPTFVVHTGDQVAAGSDFTLWPIFFDISREWMRQTVYLPALGNHEQNSPYWYQLYGRNNGYYSQDWGPIHWVILDSDAPGGAEASWKEQTAFLEQDLAAHKSARFRFVVFHHPPYTAVARRQEGAARIAERLVPLFRKHKVQGVFCGHDHNYQRHVEDGIQYVVTGGGGAPLYDVDGPIPGKTVKAEKVENFVYAEAKGSVIRFEARTPDGRVIDKFEISAQK
jgi:3',5'-cyclic AMP phosphodiesterase CpdA